MNIPEYPIRFLHEGEPYRAIFRPSKKEPSKAVVFVKTLKGETIGTRRFSPSLGTTETWVKIAKEAINGTANSGKEKGLSGPAKSSAGSEGDAESKDKAGVLSGVRSNKDLSSGPSEAYLKVAHKLHIPSVERMKKENLVFVKNARQDELYTTVPAERFNRDKMFLARWESKCETTRFSSPNEEKYWVWVYMPFPLQEWRRMQFDGNDLLRVYPQGQTKDFYNKKYENSSSAATTERRSRKKGGHLMANATAVKSSAKKAEGFKKSVGRKTGLGVFESWGKAFELYGTSKNAPAKIVSHMEADFPDKDTNWAKWVNNMRAAYNRGDERLATKRPKNPIPVYADERAGSDRRKEAKASKGPKRLD